MECNYFANSECKSCHLLDKSYAQSVLLKESELKQLFPQQISLIKPTVAFSNNVKNSRNKAKLAVFNQDNYLNFGFYHRDGSSTVLENCPLHMANINILLPTLRQILNKYKIVPYEIASKTGELKYLIISTNGNPQAEELLLRFVLRSKKLLHQIKQVVAELILLFPSIKVITANIQPIHQAVLEGEEEIVLTKNTVIIHQLDEFALAAGARSFFQVTPQIARCLYNAVAQAIALDAPSSLLDLYCGVGAFSFYASRYCADITGIEISKEAIDCANHSAVLNCSKINFQAMDVEKYLNHSQKIFDAVVVNPPRRGLNSSIIKMINTIAPRFIYYSSCNPHTLARDCHELSKEYEIKSLQIFDMFPYTNHFETLMCLVKK